MHAAIEFDATLLSLGIYSELSTVDIVNFMLYVYRKRISYE